MIDGKPNRMANRDYTFLSQIEEKRNEVFKIIFLGTEEKPTALRKEILNNLIQLLNKPFKLTKIRLEYNFLYNIQADKTELYKAFGYGILTKKIIPVSLVNFPKIHNRYFVNVKIYNNIHINKSKHKAEQEKKKTIKKPKKVVKKKYIKPKSFLQILAEGEKDV